jgi:hypothetical protein
MLPSFPKKERLPELNNSGHLLSNSDRLSQWDGGLHSNGIAYFSRGTAPEWIKCLFPLSKEVFVAFIHNFETGA